MHNHFEIESLKTEDEVKAEANTMSWVVGILLFAAMIILPIIGMKKAYIYANSFERSVAVSGKEAEALSSRSVRYMLKIKATGENFPGVTSEALENIGRVETIVVSPRYYDSIKSGDLINIEYAQRGSKLYVRHAEHHMPSWLYYIFSLLCLMGLMKMAKTQGRKYS